MNNIEANIKIIRKRIKDACLRSGRKPNEVKLLLATKTVSAELIKEALVFENNLIGENKIQELSQKFPLLKNENVAFHFIGHLQTNKVKDVLKYASCIQSVDRIELVQKLDQRLRFEWKGIDVLIQVNTSYEESKFGVSPSKAIELAKEISKYNTLKVKGLMTIGLFSAEQEKVRKCFKLLNDLKSQIENLNLPNFEMKELSMGMSNDLETAIEEGATIVRVGTAIFGGRIYPDSYYWNEQAIIK
ncbi:MAG: YggS family pyridoxal phosphate-dependent enzyme [Bacteroidetes bacterium HGW-Bacteroidetes-3]|jgi:hypothetical protein|nr:MAG: YggS family pyridoxal phosphate-dependent enzyme [Bacteroidetes bacterium HGW-Bacteroidetes-3]